MAASCWWTGGSGGWRAAEEPPDEEGGGLPDGDAILALKGLLAPRLSPGIDLAGPLLVVVLTQYERSRSTHDHHPQSPSIDLRAGLGSGCLWNGPGGRVGDDDARDVSDQRRFALRQSRRRIHRRGHHARFAQLRRSGGGCRPGYRFHPGLDDREGASGRQRPVAPRPGWAGTGTRYRSVRVLLRPARPR